jgi:hypothetical protein
MHPDASNIEPSDGTLPQATAVSPVTWDDLAVLAFWTLFGWAFIAAFVHDVVVGTFVRHWVELVPLAFCVVINVATTIEWVRYAKWRRLPLAERLNPCPFARIRELSPEEAALFEEQLAESSGQRC